VGETVPHARTTPVFALNRHGGWFGAQTRHHSLSFTLNSQTLIPRITDSLSILFIQVGESSHRYVSHPILVLFSSIHGEISHIDPLDELLLVVNSH
jgi:hypothetical protein